MQLLVNNVIRRILLLVIVLAGCLHFHAKSQPLFFEKVTGQSSYINTSVQSIAKDSLGYIWFATWNGLFRYNGTEFKVYKHQFNDPSSLPNDRLRNIITDDNQQLWVITSDRKYAKYKYVSDSFKQVDDSLVTSNVKLLLGSSCNNLNRNKEIDGFQFYMSSNIFCSRNIKTKEEIRYLPDIFKSGSITDDYISSFFIDDQNIIWVGTRNGNIFMANTFRSPFNLHYVYTWQEKSPIITSLSSVLKTKNELWLGSKYYGLLVENAKSQGINNLGALNAIAACNPKQQVYDVVDFKRTDGNYHGKLIANSNRISKTSVTLDQVRCLIQDDKGKIWIGGIDGLKCFDPELNVYYNVLYKNAFPYLNRAYVYALTKLHNGDVLLSIGIHLVRINIQNNQFIVYDFHKLIPSDIIVMDLMEDSNNNIWIATEGYGLYRIQYNSIGVLTDTIHLRNFNSEFDSPVGGEYIYNLHEDITGNIWVCTTDGLFSIEPKSFSVRKFSIEQGLNSNYVSAVTSDELGNIWVSHKKGISRISSNTWNVSNYNIGDNNMNWVFQDGALFNDTLNNIIYFGAREGYVSFNPRLIRGNVFLPNLLFEQLNLSGNPVLVGEEVNGRTILSKHLSLTKNIRLQYKNRSFGIKMSMLHYQNSKGATYWYKLDDYDDEWQQIDHNLISYKKVPPGSYTFKAKVITSDGVQSEEQTLNIKVETPLFSKWWALMIYLIVLNVALYFVFKELYARRELKRQVFLEKLNSEKQEAITKEKLEFFTNVSHELRTPLTLIVDPLKQLENTDMPTTKRSLYFSIINKNVLHLTELINQILDFRKSESEKMVPDYTEENGVEIVISAIKNFEMMAQKRNVSLYINTDLKELIGYFDKEKLKQIILNLVSNAFKYTPDGGDVSVSITKHRSDEKLIVAIQDNGIGIKNDALNRIFEPFNTEGSKPFYGQSSGMGLALTRNLIKLLGGNIQIESLPGKGTEVRFSLPYSGFNNINENDNKIVNDKTKIGKEAQLKKEDDKKPTVLIVEDNPDVQIYLRTELSDMYNIRSEENGVLGLKNAIRNIPDIIISDVMMPEMDGVEMCDKIKKNEKTSHIPIIMLTAKVNDQDRIDAFKTGADVYFSKPFNIEVLKAQIVSIIENRIKLQNKLAGKKHITELENEENILDKRFLKKTVAVINMNIDNFDFNPEMLAELLNISERQLYRKLKAVTGSTVQEFVNRVRMEKASELLVDSDMRVSEIAFQVGFSEPSNFSRAFNKHFGCSPTKYVGSDMNSDQ